MIRLLKAGSVVAALACVACGSRVERAAAPTPVVAQAKPISTPVPVATPGKKSKGVKAKPKKPKVDPLFPKRAKRGWAEIGGDGRAAADVIANDYVSFISRGKTPRRAISALVKTAEEAGARELASTEAGQTGFHFAVEKGGEAAVFFRSGSAPISGGASIIVVSVDAPRLILKQVPVETRYELEMLQTDVHGSLDLRSWMVHPLALDVYADAGGKSVAFSVGERETDPVLSVPDLLPHLSHGSQPRGKEVTDAERLDALAAAAGGTLELVRKRGLKDLTTLEAYLVPAAKAVRVGTDRALVGGYGHGHRSLAFAAVRGLAEARPSKPAIVVVVGRTENNAGNSSYAYVSRALRKALGAMAEGPIDVYDTQVALSKSIAIIGDRSSSPMGAGLFVETASADTLPTAGRIVLKTLTGASVPFKVSDKGFSSVARAISSLGFDAITMAIPTTGTGSPGGTVSVLDLYHGVLACRAWLSRSL